VLNAQRTAIVIGKWHGALGVVDKSRPAIGQDFRDRVNGICGTFTRGAALLGPLIYLSMIERSITGLSIPPLDMEMHIHSFLEGRCQSKADSMSDLIDGNRSRNGDG
jgi:hypothetical protein